MSLESLDEGMTGVLVAGAVTGGYEYMVNKHSKTDAMKLGATSAASHVVANKLMQFTGRGGPGTALIASGAVYALASPYVVPYGTSYTSSFFAHVAGSVASQVGVRVLNKVEGANSGNSMASYGGFLNNSDGGLVGV